MCREHTQRRNFDGIQGNGIKSFAATCLYRANVTTAMSIESVTDLAYHN